MATLKLEVTINDEHLEGYAIENNYKSELPKMDENGNTIYEKGQRVMESNPQSKIEFAIEQLEDKILRGLAHDSTHYLTLDQDITPRQAHEAKTTLATSMKSQLIELKKV